MKTSPANPLRAPVAGAVYFAVIFTVGFGLGIVRVLVLESAVGTLAAVLIEAPVILTCAWLVSRALLARMSPPPPLTERAIMGAAAFTCLITAEIMLTIIAFGGGVMDMVEGWLTPAGAVGLAGQIAFALFPLWMKPGRGADA